MKKLIVMMIMCCMVTGCASNNIAGDIDTGDIDVGDIDTGDIDVGDIDTGIYVKTEADNIYSIEIQYGENISDSLEVSDNALETNIYMLLTKNIVNVSEEGENVDFTITAKNEDGEVFAEGAFTYQPEKRMELTITGDGTIVE